MKRLISALLVLLALGVAAFFFIKLRPFLPERARAAELAPAETVLYLQVPNLRETAFRVPGTDLYAIWREAEVQTFLEKPRRKAVWMKEWEQRFDEVVNVAPGEMFIAFTKLGAQPAFVGGFSFAGSRRSAEALVEKSRALLPARVVTRVQGNWMLVASDEALLEQLRTRLGGKAVGPVLGGDPAFQRAVGAIGVGQDLVIYGKRDAVPGAFGSLAGSPTKSDGAKEIAMGTKIQRGKLRDAIFIPGPPRTAGVLDRRTLALAGPQTLLYLASELGSLATGADFEMAKALLPQIDSVEKTLAAKGLSWSDLPAAFGPEGAVFSEWAEGSALPSVVMAAEVRDAPKARLFVDAVTNPRGAGTAWTPQQQGGFSFATTPSRTLALIQPAVTLTDRFALAASSGDALVAALPRAAAPGPSLAESPEFQEATRLVAPDADALLYLDFQKLFDRVYRLTRPFITLSIAFSPDASAHFDAGKLPSADAISRHLSPLVVSERHLKEGRLIESTGTLTLTGLVAAAGGGVAVGGSGLSGLLPGGGIPGLSMPGFSTGARPKPEQDGKKAPSDPAKH